MSKICRTCLKKTNQTFKTSQSLIDFDSVRISGVLRFCIPELYLGLSLNPEICLSCKEDLKVAYLFKQKCLTTENKIGNYLKNVRYTGKSVDLNDVLDYLNSDYAAPIAPVCITDLGKLDDSGSADKVSTNSSEVNQSTPVMYATTTPSLPMVTNMIMKPFNLFDFIKNVPISCGRVGQAPTIVNSVITPQNEDTPNDVPQTSNSNSFCTISNVFSLSNTESNGVNEMNKANDEIVIHDDDSTTDEVVDIKEEPLDFDTVDEHVEFSERIPTDEETLDASETSSYANRCSPSLQGIIDSIPDVNHPDQYVDIPDFVTINNFGFKELEAFKLQRAECQSTSKASPAIPNLKSSISNEGISTETKDAEVATNQQDVVLLNGKHSKKGMDKYKIASDHLVLEKDDPQKQEVVASPVSRKRQRRKIRIIAIDHPPDKKRRLEPRFSKTDKDNVVVLFTSYTSDGIYINDHDYLISPYKRNKVLLVGDKLEWLCMCYICHSKHPVQEHVTHMSGHGSKCKVCLFDLGTPYMLNIHVKMHKKICPYCSQVLPYGQLRNHTCREERKMKEQGKRSRLKPRKDEKPVYFPISKQPEAPDPQLKPEPPQPDESPKTVMPEGSPELKGDDATQAEGNLRKKRGRPRRRNLPNRTVESPRTLRARVKKWYAESDEEEVQVIPKALPVAKDVSLDLKGGAK